MRVKYNGTLVRYTIGRRNFVRAYTFLNGICEDVAGEDAIKMVERNPGVFAILKDKVKQSKKPNKNVKKAETSAKKT